MEYQKGDVVCYWDNGWRYAEYVRTTRKGVVILHHPVLGQVKVAKEDLRDEPTTSR